LRDDYVADAEVGQRLLDAGLAVAAVGGHRLGGAAEQPRDPADRRRQQRGVCRVALVHVVIQHDPVHVVHDLRLVAELDRLAESGPLAEATGVGGSGPARHDVGQPGVQASVLVAGQVHHRGHRPVALRRPARSPDVLVHAQRPHAGEPVRSTRAGHRLGPHAPHRVCQSTRRWWAGAETVVSSRASASVAHPTAREVSTAGGGISSCSSDHVPDGQANSGQRHTRFNHTIATDRPKHGASAATRRRRP